MSDRTLEEMANAEVVPELTGPDQYYLRFGADDYGFVSKTERNQFIVESDLLDEAQSGLHFRWADGDNVRDVTFTADFEADRYRLEVDGTEVMVPDEYENEVLRAARDEAAGALVTVYEDIRDSFVRQEVVEQFRNRFLDGADLPFADDRDQRLDFTDDGWVIDDTFIVEWDAENYLVSNMNVHVRDGNVTVEADDSKQARDLSFETQDNLEVPTPRGSTVELRPVEQEFLASVEVLLSPHKYLDEQAADDLHQMIEANSDPISGLASTARCTGFTDETDGLYHGHGLQKHRLQDLGVTDETVERLHHRGDGHSGVHELALREQEFRNADFEVFEDAPNHDPAKWEKINNTREKAPIPDRVRRSLNEMFA